MSALPVGISRRVVNGNGTNVNLLQAMKRITERNYRTEALTWVGITLVSSMLNAAGPRGLPEGQALPDRRLGDLKDLNGYFPFEVPSTRAGWETRTQEVRERILVSQGLWPLPRKTPLNAVIHGKIELGDYSVEKVYFESFPGFFVTGNLYRPVGRVGSLPGILSPHGHWADGRFTDNQSIREELVAGAERFANGGRSPLQSRCVQLARMGCVVFHYDMIGYADSGQISYELAHRFAKQRPEMNRRTGWGLFSPQAESHLQSVMGLQSWNSIRALDFLESLPEVDSSRLGVTGASGGGTQTFVLSAIDPRPAVAFPAVMVSTGMQGGCTCENASLLRVGTGNVEIAALFAPKPLGLTGANDWTVEMSTKGFPELQALYKLMGAEGSVSLRALNHFGHNYNYVSRSAMYHWFNRHFGLGVEEPIVEADYSRMAKADLTVWNEQHATPQGGPEFERRLLEYWTDESQDQLEEAMEDPLSFAAIAEPVFETLIGRSWDSVGEVEWLINEKRDRGDYLEMSGLLKNVRHEEAVPVVFLYPKEWEGKTVLWLDPNGKDGLYDADNDLNSEVVRLLAAGVTVMGADLHFQGESLPDGTDHLEKTRRVANTREAAPYTFGYNASVFAKRVHDVLTVVKFLKTHDERSKSIAVVGLKGAGHWAAVARCLIGSVVDRFAIDTSGFRFGAVTDLHDPDFLPGGAKYLDLPGFLLVGGNQPLWLAGESVEVQQQVRTRYAAKNSAANLTVVSRGTEASASRVVAWLIP